MFVIKGALYKKDDVVLRSMHSTDVGFVEFLEYKTLEKIKAEYGKTISKTVKSNNDYIEVDDVKYYQFLYGGYTNENLELLSDLSRLEFYDPCNKF